jgi:hypothetical protein
VPINGKNISGQQKSTSTSGPEEIARGKPYVDSKRNIWAREICKQNLNAKENIYFIEKPQVGKRKGIL